MSVLDVSRKDFIAWRSSLRNDNPDLYEWMEYIGRTLQCAVYVLWHQGGSALVKRLAIAMSILLRRDYSPGAAKALLNRLREYGLVEQGFAPGEYQLVKPVPKYMTVRRPL